MNTKKLRLALAVIADPERSLTEREMEVLGSYSGFEEDAIEIVVDAFYDLQQQINELKGDGK